MSLLAAAIFLLTRAPITTASPADLVLVSARIWTGDPARPEATALAVRGGRIAAYRESFDLGAALLQLGFSPEATVKTIRRHRL